MQNEKIEMERSSLIVFSFFMISNIGNYLFQIIMGNMMSANDYGVLNTLLSLTNLSAVVSGAWLATSAKYSAQYAAEQKMSHAKLMLLRLTKQILVVSVLLFLMGTLGAPFLSALFHIENKAYVNDAVLLIAVSCVLPVFVGALQGLKRFVPYCIQNLSIVIVKLIGSIISISIGWGIRGCIGAITVGTCLAIIYCIISIRDVLRMRTTVSTMPDTPKLTQYFYNAFWIQLFLAVLNNGDMLLIKIFSPTPELAGVYSSGLILSKIPCYVSGAIVAVLFPLVAEGKMKRTDTKVLLKKAMVYGGGIAVLGAIVLNVAGDWMISLLFGERYNGTVSLLLPMSCLAVSVTFLTILINYLLPLGQTRFLTISLGIGFCIDVLLIWRYHNDIAQILYIVGAVLLLVFAGNIANIFFGSKNIQEESM